MKPLLCLFLACPLTAATPQVIRGDSTPWPRHAIDATSKGADGVKLGDFNGNGLTDLVTGWEEGGVVRVYANPGPNQVRSPWPQVTVGEVKNAEEAIFADLDGDGRLDVISGTEGKTRTLYWHRQKGGEPLQTSNWETLIFPATENMQMWMQAEAAQLDGEHGLDLLLASKNSGAAIGWLQAPAQPLDLTAWRYHRLREAGWIMSVILHDLNDDGLPDALCTDRKGERSGVFWLENPGPQAMRELVPWREHTIGGRDREVMFADIGDIDGDGLTDIAVAVKPHDILLFLRQRDGGWREQTLTLLSASLGDAKAVKIGDLNGDALPDLVFTCENANEEREGVIWLEQQRNGPWKQHSLGGPEGVKFDLIQLLDLDGDGDLDVITCEERDQLGVVWYENPKQPSLSEQ